MNVMRIFNRKAATATSSSNSESRLDRAALSAGLPSANRFADQDQRRTAKPFNPNRKLGEANAFFTKNGIVC